jgi:hypothetical protein
LSATISLPFCLKLSYSSSFTSLSSLFFRIRPLFITGITAVILPFSSYQRCVNVMSFIAAKFTTAERTGNS